MRDDERQELDFIIRQLRGMQEDYIELDNKLEENKEEMK